MLSLSKLVQLLAIAFSLAAALICYELMLKHVTGSWGSAWFEAGCGADEPGSPVNCDAVLASPYSYIPPKHPDSVPGRPHFPAAFVGWVYYSALAVWFIGIGRPAPSRRRLHLVPVFVVCAGLIASGYFTVVMFNVLNERCPWCLATHVLNALIAAAVVLMWPRAPRATPERIVAAAGSTEARAERLDTHPSGRLVLLTVLAVAITAYAELNVLAMKNWKRSAQVNAFNFQKCQGAVDRITSDATKLVRNWQLATPCAIAGRPEQPVRAYADAEVASEDIVIFSDFLCPMCRKFAALLDEEIQPLFAGRLRVAFRHYPLDASCNPFVSGTVHPHACLAATVAESALLVGGNESFWNAHDYLFSHADRLMHGQLSADDIARDIGLDPAALRSALSSPAPLDRIHEDAEQARACQIRGTPSVFVEGRLVDVLAVMDIRFWDKLADGFWKKINEPRPPGTRLVPPAGPEPTTP
jgi:protein-disulfide isomerase/uncharacterized membrane protein